MTAGASQQEVGMQRLKRKLLAKEKENDDNQEHQGASGERAENCTECRLPLARSSYIITIGGLTDHWHAECFKCAVCREPMDKRQSCHLVRDQVICHNDYLRLKRDCTVNCARCRWPIAASDWVRKADTYVYHIACFNCDICLRQLNTGEQFIIDSRRHTMGALDHHQDGDKVRLLCRLHFNVEAPSGQPLEGNSRGDKTNTSLAGDQRQRSESPAGDAGQHVPQKCRKTFNRQQSLQCTPIALTSERASPSRSSPSLADQPAPLGDRESQSQDRDQDQEQEATVGSQSQSQPPPSRSRPQLTPSSSSMLNDFALDSQRLTVATSLAANLSSSSSSSASTSSLHNYLSPMTPTNNSQASSGLPCKSKRVRTTFTEDQLSILQTHFQIDSNPDGQDLERIATITGLSKRVTQVWFQNSRARQKKYMIKRKPMGVTTSLAMNASFSITSVVGNLAGGDQQQSFRVAPNAPNDLYGANPDGGSRDQLERAKAALANSWQVSQEQLALAEAPVERGARMIGDNFQDGHSSSSDDGDRSIVMDQDSRETNTD